jgi:iron complex outermembrane receptor protein
MRRDNFSWTGQLKASEKQKLSAAVLFTDMFYETPGALTLAEFTANPKAARPAGGGFPSAVAAHAAIYQKNILAGITNEYAISSSVSNTTNLYAGFSQIKNSAIRNYERRNEPQFGGRSTFTWLKKKEQTGWKLAGGMEFQQGFFNTQVSQNKNGTPDTIQTNDDVNYTAYSVFLQGDVDINDHWIITAGASINKNKVGFTRLSVYPTWKQNRTYKNEIAPRISLLRKLNNDFSLLATVSKGFSPPTVAELLPSTGVISTDLEAEQGWNYEFTVRKYLLKTKLQLEATGFYFKLDKALVQRRDLSGADYFVNAGDIREKGLELHADYTLFSSRRKFTDYLVLRADYTYNHFRYGSFVKGSDNFSGREVPSVPSNTFSAMADLQLKAGVYTNITYYGASSIYLNDANSASARPYHLLGWRLGWRKTFHQKIKLNFYAGADNLLDESYSLGNDINAAANRFYNAAPKRNYYAGIGFQFVRVGKK